MRSRNQFSTFLFPIYDLNIANFQLRFFSGLLQNLSSKSIFLIHNMFNIYFTGIVINFSSLSNKRYQQVSKENPSLLYFVLYQLVVFHCYYNQSLLYLLQKLSVHYKSLLIFYNAFKLLWKQALRIILFT